MGDGEVLDILVQRQLREEVKVAVDALIPEKDSFAEVVRVMEGDRETKRCKLTRPSRDHLQVTPSISYAVVRKNEEKPTRKR